MWSNTTGHPGFLAPLLSQRVVCCAVVGYGSLVPCPVPRQHSQKHESLPKAGFMELCHSPIYIWSNPNLHTTLQHPPERSWMAWQLCLGAAQEQQVLPGFEKQMLTSFSCMFRHFMVLFLDCGCISLFAYFFRVYTLLFIFCPVLLRYN